MDVVFGRKWYSRCQTFYRNEPGRQIAVVFQSSAWRYVMALSRLRDERQDMDIPINGHKQHPEVAQTHAQGISATETAKLRAKDVTALITKHVSLLHSHFSLTHRKAELFISNLQPTSPYLHTQNTSEHPKQNGLHLYCYWRLRSRNLPALPVSIPDCLPRL